MAAFYLLRHLHPLPGPGDQRRCVPAVRRQGQIPAGSRRPPQPVLGGGGLPAGAGGGPGGPHGPGSHRPPAPGGPAGGAGLLLALLLPQPPGVPVPGPGGDRRLFPVGDLEQRGLSGGPVPAAGSGHRRGGGPDGPLHRVCRPGFFVPVGQDPGGVPGSRAAVCPGGRRVPPQRRGGDQPDGLQPLRHAGAGSGAPGGGPAVGGAGLWADLLLLDPHQLRPDLPVPGQHGAVPGPAPGVGGSAGCLLPPPGRGPVPAAALDLCAGPARPGPAGVVAAGIPSEPGLAASGAAHLLL